MLQKPKSCYRVNFMSEQHWATPTYQSNLNAAIRDVAIRLTTGCIYESYLALETLYALLPPDCEEQVSKKYAEIQKEMKYISTLKGVNSYDTKLVQQKLNSKTLRQANFALFREIKKVLFEHHWLVNESNRPATRKSDLTQIGRALE